MYISDYMYAADLSVCTGIRYDVNNTVVDYRNTNCKGTDWLYNSSMIQWTLSPLSDNAHDIFSVYSAGNVLYYYAYGVQPVVFLKSNITISEGLGTSGEPYQLTLSE